MQTHYVYVSNDVRICGNFFKSNGVHGKKNLGNTDINSLTILETQIISVGISFTLKLPASVHNDTLFQCL